MNSDDLIAIALKNKARILALAVATAAVVYLVGLFMMKYDAQAMLVIKPIGQNPAGMSQTTPSAMPPAIGLLSATDRNALTNFGETYIHTLYSRDVIAETVHRLVASGDLQLTNKDRTGFLDKIKDPLRILFYGRPPAVDRTPRNKAIDRLKKDIKAKLLQNSLVMQIAVQDPSADRAAAIVNTLSDVFIEHTAQLNKHDAELISSYLREKLDAISEQLLKLNDMENSIKASGSLYSFDDLSNKMQTLRGRLDSMEQEIENNVYEAESLRKSIDRLTQKLSTYPQYSLHSSIISENSRLSSLKDKILNLRLNILQNLIEFSPDSSQMAGLRSQLSEVEKELSQEIGKSLTSETRQRTPVYETLLTQKVNDELRLASIPLLNKQLRARILQTRNELQKLDDITVRLTNIAQQQSTLESQKKTLHDIVNYTNILEEGSLREARLLEKATIPRYPAIRGMPLAVLTVVGFIIGAMLGSVTVLIRDQSLRQS